MAALSGALFHNRELSWLEFNQRVLDQARDPNVPLLERVRFLAISSSNLDEFFMVRVGGLQMLEARGVRKTDPAGMRPAQQLRAITGRVRRMVSAQYACYREEIEPALVREGIARLGSDALSEEQLRHLHHVFENELFPLVSPVALRKGEMGFPLVMNRLLHVAVRLKPPSGQGPGPDVAIVAVPKNLSRFIALPARDGDPFILVEDVIAMHVRQLFPGYRVLECVPFRITRNADLGVREDMAGDLMQEMEAVLDARKRSDCVRMEIADRASASTVRYLRGVLGVTEESVYYIAGPLDLAAFMSVSELRGHDRLKYRPWPSPEPSGIPAGQSVFQTLAGRDVLLYHPFESFNPVVRFIDEAANDSDVLAIKQILYRISTDSPIIAALKRAARRGKYVTAIVELKARFDEARNIEWARELEDAGVQVVYGVKRLKTHAKACLVIRGEAAGLRRYVHFGTGNYNESTARLYTDVSYMSADEDLGADASAFFNTITGYSQPVPYRKLAAAPISLREKIIGLIEAEAERKRQRQKALIMAKMNSLVDVPTIEALYAAAQAGVEILLNVRGICCLRAGVPGLSETIRVISIVDRFLEHSRIFYFHSGGEPKVFLSSADWMPRNLDRRIELLVPVAETQARSRLTEILHTCFADTANAWELKSDGTYRRCSPKGKRRRFRSQREYYQLVCGRAGQAAQVQRTVFEPHRPPPSGRNHSGRSSEE